MAYERVRLIPTPTSTFLLFVCDFSTLKVTEKTEVEVLFMQIITEKDKNELGERCDSNARTPTRPCSEPGVFSLAG